jgi:hypothetical protein
MISLICPSRSSPKQSFDTISKWLQRASNPADVEVIISLDEDDPSLLDYFNFYDCHFNTFKHTKLVLPNKSSVEAINNAAKIANGNIFMVVGDDQDCCTSWDARILNYTAKKTDWVLKVRDGLQNKIITLHILNIYFLILGSAT